MSTPHVPPLARPEEFRGRVAVVTGGTSGLGRHLTQTLVELGATVFFCGTRREAGEILAAELGAGARFVPCDLRAPAEARRFVEQAGGASGRIDYLVNNAATDPRIGFEAATVEDFDRLMAVNLRPYFVVSQAALPYLKTGAGKAIVNLLTTNYMLGLSPFTLYNASKSAILGFTRSLARELGPLGIRVNGVSPGWIMTDKQLRDHVQERDKQELLEAQCLKYLLTEQHVTPLILFLLSAAASGITGQNIVVDGGKVVQ